MEIDSTKSDRVEWCHVGYHSNYCPENAFEIELQWLTSTPSLLLDIVSHKLGDNHLSRQEILRILRKKQENVENEMV